MGYSARYHAASLAAIFLALGIGILIGAAFGRDVVSGTTESLEESLKTDLQDARERAEALQGDLDRELRFAEAAYPALVNGLLRDRRVAIVSLGELPGVVLDDAQEVLGPAGAELAAVTIVRPAPDLGAMAEALGDTPYRRLARDPETLERFAERVGRALVRGGGLVSRVRGELLERFSGRAEGIDAVVVTHDPPPGDLEPADAVAVERLQGGILDGVRRTGLPVVGVERSDEEPSSVGVFNEHGLSTVDSVDLVAGQVALAYVLRGAEGDFGIKDTADRLLPELRASYPRPARR